MRFRPHASPPATLVALSLSLAALSVAGCSRSDSDSQSAPASVAAATAASEPPATVDETGSASAQAAPPATVGGDGSAIVLTPLSADDIKGANLPGELGCSFSTPGASPLLVAMGNVASPEAAQGVVKVGRYVERVATPGGFDAMLKGATFSGAGKVVRIDLTGPASGGGESPPRPATLTYDRADGARLTRVGLWSCGP